MSQENIEDMTFEVISSKFEEGFEQAEKDEILVPLPADESGFKDGLCIVKTIRDRLFRLGYQGAEKNLDSSDVDDHLKKLIIKFQNEVGIEPDGWVGTNTWQSLQELFTFETPINVSTWLTDDKRKCAFNRAINLRLKTVGLSCHNDMQEKPDFTELQAIFSKIGVKQKILDDLTKLQQLLFDHDRMLSHIIKQRKHFNLSILRRNPILKNFLFNIVKIELWLDGGSTVKPDGRPLETWFIKKRRKPRVYSDFYIAMKNFSKEHGYKTFPITTKRIIDRIALRRMLNIFWELERRENSLSEDEENKLLEKVKDSTDFENEWKKKSVAARMFDGLRRLCRKIWNWIKDGFNKIKKIIKEKVSQIVRYFKQKAIKAASLVRRVTAIFADSIQYLTGEDRINPDQTIALKHDSDFDFKLFVAKNTSKEKLDTFFQGLKDTIVRFEAFTKIVKILIFAITEVLKGIVAATAGPVGWVNIVRMIISFMRKIKKDDILIIKSAIQIPA